MIVGGAAAIGTTIFRKTRGALQAAEITTVYIKIPSTVRAVGLCVQRIIAELLGWTARNVVRMRAIRALGAAVSERGYSGTTVDFLLQTGAILAEGPSK